MKWEFGPDVETRDWIGRDLQNVERLYFCVYRLEQDLEEEIFAWWEAVVRREQGLPPLEILDDRFIYRDPHEIRFPRPTLPWYEIVRQVVGRMLLEPFDPRNQHHREIALAWPRLAAAIEEHGYGLSLPGDITAPLDVVPAGLRGRLWEQYESLKPRVPLPAETTGEVISLDKILPFMMHADVTVRDTAAWYAARVHTGRAEVTDHVIAAMDEFGVGEAFGRAMFLKWLKFDDAQFARLLDLMAVECAAPEPDTIQMAILLDYLPPTLLAAHRKALFAIPWESLPQSQLADKIAYHDEDADEVWNAFVRELQRFEEDYDDPDLHAFMDGMLGSVTDNLLDDPRLKQWVLDVLDTPPTADGYSPIRETAAICLAGDLRLEASVPMLVRRLHRDRGMYHDDLDLALANIRSASVVSQLHDRLPWAGETFCHSAIGAVADMFTPLSQATLRCWLEILNEQRQQVEASADNWMEVEEMEMLAGIDRLMDQVLEGMVRQLMPDGVSAAQEFIESGEAGAKLCEFTVAACTILGLEFGPREMAEEIIAADEREYTEDDVEWDDEPYSCIKS